MVKKLSRRELVAQAAGASAGAVAAACASSATVAASDPVPSSQLRIRQEPSGRITVVGRDVTIPTLLEYSKDWMSETGITVEPVVIGTDLGRKILQSAVTGAFLADVQLHDDNYGAELYAREYYSEVPEAVKAAVNWEDIVPFYRDKLSGWQDTTYGIPYDGDNMFHTYRRDIMADEENQERFNQQYGYQMDPATGPKTWEEYRQYAAFFTGENDSVEYGFASMFRRNGGLFWAYISRAAAYAKHPEVPDFYFNLETGEPLINSEAFVRALGEWKEEMEQYAAPGAINVQWGETIDQFLVGRIAMLNYWADVGKDAQDEENSTVKGDLGFHYTPGSKEVFNPIDNEWTTLPEVSYAPFFGFGGRNFAVARASKNADAAWEFLQHACTPEMTARVSVTPGSGMDPVRESQFDPAVWVDSPFQWDQEQAEAYLETIKANVTHPNIVPDLRLPGWTQYQDSLETSLSAALAGDVDPEEALNQVSDEWAVITDQLGGADRQMQFYRDLITDN